MAGVSSVIKIAEVACLSQPGALPWGFVDRPVSDTTVYGDQVEVLGWALSQRGTVSEIEVEWDGRVLARVPPGLPRPDVAAAYPGVTDAERSGFWVAAEAPERSHFELRVSAVADGERSLLATVHAQRFWRDPPANDPRVSIVIPCFEQAHYLGEAIDSVREQTYTNFEIIVVDDGSGDETAEVAVRHGARCLRQENRGPSAARNRGLAASSGEYLVFLDADDVLFPHALEAGLHSFEDHPEAMLVAGPLVRIDPAGQPIRELWLPQVEVPDDFFAALLADNFIWTTGAVMFRRSVFDSVGGWDSSLDPAEDHDLYLRISHEHPIHLHQTTICGYRQHGGQTSSDLARMLRSTVRVFRKHRRATRQRPDLREAYRRGLEECRSAYGEPLARGARTALDARRWVQSLRMAATLLRWHPKGLLGLAAPARSGNDPPPSSTEES